MRRTCTLGIAVFLGSLPGLPGQTPPAEPSAFAKAVIAEITSQEEQFLEAAKSMPADRFDASPEGLKISGSDFKGVRSFAEQVKHVAADNFSILAPLTGKPEPAGLNPPNGPPEMKSRAEILKLLEDSFAYGHKAASTLTSENALELVEFRRGRKVTRLFLVVLALTHMSDHYGQLALYLRMYGIVPPASRPRK